jgi:hypothetical protein
MKIRKMKPQAGRWYVHRDLTIYIESIVCSAFAVYIQIKCNNPDIDQVPYLLRRKIYFHSDRTILQIPHFQFFREYFREATVEETVLYKAQSV